MFVYPFLVISVKPDNNFLINGMLQKPVEPKIEYTNGRIVQYSNYK